MGNYTFANKQWDYFSHNGKIGIACGTHSILYNRCNKLYHIRELGKTIFIHQKLSQCMLKVPDIIDEFTWEIASKEFTPFWNCI